MLTGKCEEDFLTLVVVAISMTHLNPTAAPLVLDYNYLRRYSALFSETKWGRNPGVNKTEKK